MKISRNEGLAIAAVAVIGFLGWRLFKSEEKLKDKKAEYNTDLEQVKADITEEIRNHVHDDIIDKAISKAADKQVESLLDSAKNDAVCAIETRLIDTIEVTVESTWNKLKMDVESDLLAKVGEIDTTEIKREAIEKARDKAVSEASEAIDKVVDDIRDKFDKRATEVIKAGEKKYNKRLSSNLDYLKSRYQDTIWDSMWR